MIAKPTTKTVLPACILAATLAALILVMTLLNNRTYASPGADIPTVAAKQPSCTLCNIRPASSQENDLSILLINSRQQLDINLVQYTQDGQPSDHSIFFADNGDFGDADKGCQTKNQYIGLPYGHMEMTIIPGKSYPPDQTKLCADCYAAVQQASPGFDLLLIDHRGQRIYDLCEKPYDFSIRKYQIVTRPKWDGSIHVTIKDTTIYKELSTEC